MDQHRLQEERSIAYHRALADKIRTDPSLLDPVRRRVRSWRAEGKLHGDYAEAWLALLARPLNDLLGRLVDPGEEMRALRQCTPLVGILDPRERWAIWRETRDQLTRP